MIELGYSTLYLLSEMDKLHDKRCGAMISAGHGEPWLEWIGWAAAPFTCLNPSTSTNTLQTVRIAANATQMAEVWGLWPQLPHDILDE